LKTCGATEKKLPQCLHLIASEAHQFLVRNPFPLSTRQMRSEIVPFYFLAGVETAFAGAAFVATTVIYNGLEKTGQLFSFPI
jgi:hypothetical protein